MKKLLKLDIPFFELAAALALVYSAYLVFAYAKQPLLDEYSFRQTQTALTSYWFTKEKFKLAYETPVAGAPWSIPFEFPIYQLIVAYISSIFHVSLDITGRLTSYAFLILSIFPVRSINKRLGFSDDILAIFVAIVFSMPIYIYWGRTFMIETAALFFTIAALKYFTDFLNGDYSFLTKILFIVFASLAILQKSTTAVPAFMVLATIFLLLKVKKDNFSPRAILSKEFIVGVVLIAVPVLIGLSWVIFSDQVKLENSWGKELTSSVLAKWNWGTISQRLSSELWIGVIWGRIFNSNMGGALGLFLIALALLASNGQRVAVVILSAIALGIAPMMMFTNLHIVHDYYQTANVIFFAYALALSIGMVLLPRIGRAAAVSALVIIMLSSHIALSSRYLPIIKKDFSSENREIGVAEVLKRELPVGSQFVAFGLDWTSSLAYFSQRKSFTVPKQKDFKDYEQVLHNPEKFVDNGRLGGYVFCSDVIPNIPEFFDNLGDKASSWKTGELYRCLIAVREEPVATIFPKPSHCIGSIDKAEVENKNGKIYLSFQGWAARENEKPNTLDEVVLAITHENTPPLYYRALKVFRGDVNRSLGLPSDHDVGFSRILTAEIGPGDYQVEIIQHSRDEYSSCGIRKSFNVR